MQCVAVRRGLAALAAQTDLCSEVRWMLVRCNNMVHSGEQLLSFWGNGQRILNDGFHSLCGHAAAHP
eukprot:8175313-Alexandrium_andersonii.AAC.1